MERPELSLNGDLSVRVAVDTEGLEWTPSPSGHVLRKRLHLVGGAESGQVTSLVRYRPGASFPEHDHPEGEEIFVLEGVFSDQLGDAYAGMHLLNPEGFRHAPWSEPGCLILVKLRQYAGEGRSRERTDTTAMAWQPGEAAGLEFKSLHADPRMADTTRLERWTPGARPGPRTLPGGLELFVIEGSLEDPHGRYPKGSWLRLPDGATFDARSSEGCLLYVKAGALPTLRSGVAVE